MKATPKGRAVKSEAVATVSDYIARFPPPVAKTLAAVRRTITRAVPKAEERIAYGMPGYKLNGRVLIYFAAWTNHFSIYPATAPLMAAYKNALAPHHASKGTLRFELTEKPPLKLIEQIARFRAAEVGQLPALKSRKAAR